MSPRPSAVPSRAAAPTADAAAPSVPALTAAPAPRQVRVVEHTTEQGLRVVVVRKPGVPLVELRLRVPFLSAAAGHPARAALLADTLLTGAGGYDRAGLAVALQTLGADLHAGVDSDRFALSASVLATGVGQLLDVLAVVLTEPTFAKDEVQTERDRLVERLMIARSRSGTVAGEALAARMYGDHPYAHALAQADQVAATTPAQLRRLFDSRLRPDGATLVIVGDVSPTRVLGQVEKALAGWTGTVPRPRVPALPDPEPRPLLVVDRPGAVQSSLRYGRGALTRTDPDYAALQLANLVFGGYFSSRWTRNLREDKGYTYGPHSRIEHDALGSVLLLDAEVDVTAPSVLETRYELGRLALLGVTQDELDDARQYAIGSLALSTATQAGLAATLSALAALGLGWDWVREHPARLQNVGVEDVNAAAARFFAPETFTGVVVGDAASISEPLAALGPVERAAGAPSAG